MPTVTFQVIEGIDKGRIFREVPTPVTIGREEGNVLRLNDERVSRFHAKVQFDNGEVVITDLESTNGTRINGNVVQIRRLKAGDQVGVGRSLLLFGSEQEITARAAALQRSHNATVPGSSAGPPVPATLHAKTSTTGLDDLDFDIDPKEQVRVVKGEVFLGQRPLPPLPQRMSPSQAARLSELLEFLHHHLTAATAHVQANEDATQVALNFADWQRILHIEMMLARYVRAVSEPDTLEE